MTAATAAAGNSPRWSAIDSIDEGRFGFSNLKPETRTCQTFTRRHLSECDTFTEASRRGHRTLVVSCYLQCPCAWARLRARLASPLVLVEELRILRDSSRILPHLLATMPDGLFDLYNLPKTLFFPPAILSRANPTATFRPPTAAHSSMPVPCPPMPSLYSAAFSANASVASLTTSDS